jgi:putative hydroxymethylpyrimidine transport system substrate-binding protein
MSALRRGATELKRRPDEGVRALVKANPDLDPKLQTASVRATLPYFLPPAGKPYGWQDPAAWKRFGRWMQDAGLINTGAAGAFTNTYLPGTPVH